MNLALSLPSVDVRFPLRLFYVRRQGHIDGLFLA